MRLHTPSNGQLSVVAVTLGSYTAGSTACLRLLLFNSAQATAKVYLHLHTPSCKLAPVPLLLELGCRFWHMTPVMAPESAALQHAYSNTLSPGQQLLTCSYACAFAAIVQMDCLAHEASHGTQVASVAAGDASYVSGRPW
jgi:hypothetical protein